MRALLILWLCGVSICLGGTLEEGVAWQIALEREGFSPGVIDGKPGAKTKIATEYFQRSRGLSITGELDEATAQALAVVPEQAITEHHVERVDTEGHAPFTDDWNERAAMDRMAYYSALDAIAERFHATKALIERLNPEVDFDNLRVGTPLKVPAILPPVERNASSLKVDLGRKLIMALDDKGAVIALFHCSIAANVEKRPAGETRIVTVIRDPNYTFNPDAWPEVKNVNGRLLISPGPRNPVGMAWIGLDLPGYGIHGTPQPEMIGKTGSHGCFRMTNWDAVRLTGMVSQGMRVEFVQR